MYTKSINTVSSASRLTESSSARHDDNISCNSSLAIFRHCSEIPNSITCASQLLQERKCDELFVLNY